jgi:hypothetical protein
MISESREPSSRSAAGFTSTTRPSGSRTTTASVMVSNTRLRAIGAMASSRERYIPQTSTPPQAVNANGARSTRPNGPMRRLNSRLSAQGTNWLAIRLMLARRYTGEARSRVATNNAEHAHRTRSM